MKRTTLQLATVAVNQTPLDWAGNRERILAALASFSRREVRPEVVLLPELCVTGYGCEDAFHSIDVSRRALASVLEIAGEARKSLPHTLVFVGLPIHQHGHVYNCMAALYDGGIVALVPKRNLAGDGVHYEPRWFVAHRGAAGDLQIPGQKRSIPFGPLCLDFRGTRLAVEICEDAWVPGRPALAYKDLGVDLILNPAASHFAFHKYDLRRQIALESSRNFGCVYASVNLLGNESGRTVYDGATTIAAGGVLLYEDRGFSFQDYVVHDVALDIDRFRTLRSRLYSFHQSASESSLDREDLRIVPIDTNAPAGPTLGFATGNGETKAESTNEIPQEFTPIGYTKEQEFQSALQLALFDYVRKARSQGFVVSLSGGADSACCAILVQRALAAAMNELGSYALKKLGRDDLADNVRDIEIGATGKALGDALGRVMPDILHTIYQGTAQSSDTTREAAELLAEALGCDHHSIDVDPIVGEYRQRMESILKRELDWERDDITLQNIQARARSPMAWMFANATNSLLLTTGNRSEAAVGYATMDGDTSGGLAPIAGTDKDFVQHWLRHMQTKGDDLLGPIPELSMITEQAPTAELRPSDQHQTDETDLMPYRVLNAIEMHAVRDRKSPAEVLTHVVHEFSEHDPSELSGFVRTFFRLWSINQWKRERLAPSFHVDDRNLDPRSWYRFPILNSGYLEELEELKP